MPVKYNNKEVHRINDQLFRQGFTQEGVNEVYRLLGLSNPPTVPASLIGNRPGAARASIFTYMPDGSKRHRTSEEADFFNQFKSQTQDPYREYGIGNYLGLAGLIAGTAGALSGAGTAAAPTSAASGGIGSGIASGVSSGFSSGIGTATGATAGGIGTNALAGAGSLGVFANNGANGLAGVGGGNAGALASSGGITGGAGTGGTTAGALGSASGAVNALSGVGSGGSMGWDWGALLEYGVPLIGGLLEREGSRDAARASSQASQAAIDEQRRQYDTTRADLQPWMTAGRNALGNLENPGAAFSASPDYAFRRAEGNRGIENSFAARGGAASGNALRALNEFNSNLASGEFGNWWNRQAGLAGVGQAATTNVSNFGASSANNIGGLLQNQGNARASGIEGSTNAGTNTLANLLAIWQRRNGSTLGA